MEKKDDVNEYLIQGMYGTKEIKRDEKIRFLGTFRERVVIALTQTQVRSKSIYPEVESRIRRFPKAAMLLNGEMGYEYLVKYIELANRHNLSYTMVSDRETDTELGLVLANPDAVELESIFIEEEAAIPDPEAGTGAKEASKNRSFLQRLFNRD
jgi:uncharacterized protein YueI